MLLKHFPVVQDTRRVRHIGDCVCALHRNQLQRLVDIKVSLFDILEPRIVGNIRDDLGIHKIGVVDISPDPYNIRVILPDKPRFQNCHCVVGELIFN